jgi:hypothetical protein
MPARLNPRSEKGKPHGWMISQGTPKHADMRNIVPTFPAISGLNNAIRMILIWSLSKFAIAAHHYCLNSLLANSYKDVYQTAES